MRSLSWCFHVIRRIMVMITVMIVYQSSYHECDCVSLRIPIPTTRVIIVISFAGVNTVLSLLL